MFVPKKGEVVHLVPDTAIYKLYHPITGTNEAVVGESSACGRDKDGNVIDPMHVPLRDPKHPNCPGSRIVMREYIIECVEADRAAAAAAIATR